MSIRVRFKYMKKYISIALLALFIVPSVALASWWNPFTWKIFKKKEVVSQPQAQEKAQELDSKTSEEKISDLQKEIDALKNSKLISSEIQKESKKEVLKKSAPTTSNNTNTYDNEKVFDFMSPSDIGKLQEANFSAISNLEKRIINVNHMNDSLVQTLYIASGSSKKVGEDTITLLIKAKTAINQEIVAREQLAVFLEDLVKSIKFKEQNIYSIILKNINEISAKISVLKEDSNLKYNEASNSFSTYDSFFK
jgi:hypothetical protein